MDAIIDFLIGYGYWGMLVASFLAGSVFPFSSELVMTALMATGLDPWQLALYGTVGNVLGSGLNYCVGRLGKVEWFERYLHVSPKDMERAERFMAGRGAWMGFFAFLPIIGTAICILLGLMRANPYVSAISVFLGKIVRYLIVAYTSMQIF